MAGEVVGHEVEQGAEVHRERPFIENGRALKASSRRGMPSVTQVRPAIRTYQ